MKKIIFTLSLLAALGGTAFAQCDKPVVLNSSKTDHLDAKGAVTRTVNEAATVEISKTELTISLNGEVRMSGKIESTACNWTVPYKEGKTTLKAVITAPNGESKDVSITIEGKEGKVTLLFEMEGEEGDNVRVTADKFAAKS